MRTHSLSRPLFVFGLVLAVPLLTGADGAGCGPGQVIIGNDTGGSGSDGCKPLPCPSSAQWDQALCACVGDGGSPVCTASSCGAAVPTVAEACPGGTTVGPTCGVTAENVCGWVFPPCPTGPCTTAECGPLPPVVDNCPGGAVVTPVCGIEPDNGCGWIIPSCPTTSCTSSDCGPAPDIEMECDGTAVSPVCQPDPSTGCSWIFPLCLPGGAVDGGAPSSVDAGG